MNNILIVEDDRDIARLLQDYLRQAGFDTHVAHDGVQAIDLVSRFKPSLIVLDLGLPARDGLDVIKDIRRDNPVPIVIVTARGEETDRVLGLELGADDYVVKPFSPREVVARVRAVLRRASNPVPDEEVIQNGLLTIDFARLRVTVGQNPVELTNTEFQLLATMAKRPGRVFTRGQLLDAVHGIAFEGYERAIDAHIKNIRRKIESNSSRPHFIQTVYGVGYRFAEDT